MDVQQLRELKPELESFLKRYLPLFAHEGNQANAERFIHGLLLGGERRNAENIAQAIEGSVVRNLQCFISQAVWRDDVVLREAQRHAVELLGDDDASVQFDETGFPKKGTKSVGVKRQYSGTLGRVDNCQVAVLAGYASQHGHTLLDRRLFLPEDWAADLPRRQEAGVPDNVIFRSKPELAVDMMIGLWMRKVPFKWVTGDSVYGNSPTFVEAARLLNKLYVLEVGSQMHVWLHEPKQGEKPMPVGEILPHVPAGAWRRVNVGEGSQGPRLYEFAQLEVWFSEDGKVGPKEKLLVQRGLGPEVEYKYHRSNAPVEVPLSKVAEVSGRRWTIEVDIQAGKGECGLDEYETRGWVGWHHHTALALLALLFLTSQKRRLGGKRAPDDGAASEGGSEILAGRASLG
jgi:SRSO17 transposase